MAIAVRRSITAGLKAGLAALLFTGVVAAPASAATNTSPDAEYYVSSVTSIQPAVPGLKVSVSSADGTVTVTNGTGKTVTVVGYGNEDYLRIGPGGVQENTNSLTSVINASQSMDKLPANMAAVGGQMRSPNWVSKGTQPTANWHDYRVLWNNQQRPPIVAADPHGAHQVFSWAVQLKVDNQPVLVLGDVKWTGTPWLSTLQIVLIVAAVTVLLAVAFLLIRRRRTPRSRRGRRLAEPRMRGHAPVPSMRGY